MNKQLRFFMLFSMMITYLNLKAVEFTPMCANCGMDIASNYTYSTGQSLSILGILKNTAKDDNGSWEIIARDAADNILGQTSGSISKLNDIIVINFNVTAPSSNSFVIYFTYNKKNEKNPASKTLTMFNSVPLPVELVSFNASISNGKTLLKWKTASEKENDHFEVQRSTDGFKFSPIARVKGAGTTNEAQEYQFVDESSSKNVRYYRLKQVDFDKTVNYSKIISALGDEAKFGISKINTLVSEDGINLVYFNEEKEPITIEIIDLSGKIRYSQKIESIDSFGTVRISSENLTTGMYLLRLSNKKETKLAKIVVQ